MGDHLQRAVDVVEVLERDVDDAAGLDGIAGVHGAIRVVGVRAASGVHVDRVARAVAGDRRGQHRGGIPVREGDYGAVRRLDRRAGDVGRRAGRQEKHGRQGGESARHCSTLQVADPDRHRSVAPWNRGSKRSTRAVEILATGSKASAREVR